MLKVISICCLMVLEMSLYGAALSHPEAEREYSRLKKIGTVSKDGETVTITKAQLDTYIKSHAGEIISLPNEIADFLIDLGLKTVGNPVNELIKRVLLQPLTTGVQFNVMISHSEYTEALEEGGPIAAALTNQYGDGCSVV